MSELHQTKDGDKKVITLQNRSVEYVLKVSARARMLRLAVYRGGEFVVTAPRHASESSIEKFIVQKSQWVLDKIDHAARLGPAVPRLVPKGSRADYKKYKEQALALATGKTAEFNRFYGFSYNRISIRNQKTRWGSCSKNGNINYNYRIALLPEPLADYLVVHELCHLGQMNHSRKFWDLVAKTIPDYKERRRALRSA